MNLRDEASDELSSTASDEVITELSSALFASLRRRDQRVMGEHYIRGLVSLDGRKTMRSIAQLFGGGSVQQRMQHFISSSSWDWVPVRQALRAYLDEAMAPRAWVVQQMVVRKAGVHSVGVERSFVRSVGRTVNIQQAFGAWYASEHASAPVNWRLFLPESWLHDKKRRTRAGIPEGCTEELPYESACRAALEMAAAGQDDCRLPVVLDIGPIDPRTCIHHFADAGVPVLLRVTGRIRLVAVEPSVPALAGGDLPIRNLAETVARLRRPVGWSDPSVSGPQRSCAVATPVILPTADGEHLPLLLLGEWNKPGQGPDRLWLTNLTDHSASELLRLTKLTLRVEHDFTCVSKRVGIQDFEGRTFRGWHRHVSLASAAHAATILGTADAAGQSVAQGAAPLG